MRFGVVGPELEGAPGFGFGPGIILDRKQVDGVREVQRCGIRGELQGLLVSSAGRYKLSFAQVITRTKEDGIGCVTLWRRCACQARPKTAHHAGGLCLPAAYEVSPNSFIALSPRIFARSDSDA